MSSLCIGGDSSSNVVAQGRIYLADKSGAMNEPVVINLILGGAGYLPAHRQDQQRAERLLPPRKHLRVLFSPACRVSGWAGMQPSAPKLHASYHLAYPLEGEVFGERSVSRASVFLLELRSSHCLFNKMNREVKPAICPPPAAEERWAESAEPGAGETRMSQTGLLPSGGLRSSAEFNVAIYHLPTM